MFSQPSDKTTHLLISRSQYKEDSYILYKGRMVSSNLIDIEVIMRNHSEIKSKIIVDPKDDVEVLKLRIVELVEKFPKLSGLSELVANNLSNKGNLIQNGVLEEYISAKDTVYFDLDFQEFWIEIDMTLLSDENVLKISFELKVKVNLLLLDLKHILMKMGIKSWEKYVSPYCDSDSDFEDPDFYMFSNFTIIFPQTVFKSKNTDEKKTGLENININIEMDNFQERIKDKLDFQSKVECKLEFVNLNDNVYKEIMSMTEKQTAKQKTTWLSQFDFNRRKVLKKFIYEYIYRFIRTDLKGSDFSSYKNVIWKWNNEFTESNSARHSSFHFTKWEDESRRESFIDDTYSYCNSYLMETRCLPSKYYESVHILQESSHKINHKNYATFDNKYQKDLNVLNSIDCFKTLNKFSHTFLSNLEFKSLYVPDTINFKKISRENSIRKSKIESFFKDKVDVLSKFNSKIKSKFKYLKKNFSVVALVIFIFILLLFLFN